MGLRMKNFNIIGSSLKNQIFRGRFPKKTINRGELPDIGGWYLKPLNTGGTSNVCLLTKFCRLATVCSVIIYTKFQNNWILGNCFFNGVYVCGHW